MKISIIVAAAANNVIGRDNGMPWHLPEDLRRFKALTTGKPILMGRKTHQSIGKALPDRRNIILSRDLSFTADGCDVVASIDEALDLVAGEKELMVIGGNAVYDKLFPQTQRVYLTRIHSIIEGDTLFPELKNSDWQLVEREDFLANDQREYSFSFLVLDRR